MSEVALYQWLLLYKRHGSLCRSRADGSIPRVASTGVPRSQGIKILKMLALFLGNILIHPKKKHVTGSRLAVAWQ